MSVTASTTWEEFVGALKESVRASISPMNLKLALTALQQKAEQREREQRRQDVRGAVIVLNLMLLPYLSDIFDPGISVVALYDISFPHMRPCQYQLYTYFSSYFLSLSLSLPFIIIIIFPRKGKEEQKTCLGIPTTAKRDQVRTL